MSKQSDAKKAQNYRKTPDTCVNCIHFERQIVEVTSNTWSGPYVYTVDKNLRCKLGEFAVTKGATCDRHMLGE